MKVTDIKQQKNGRYAIYTDGEYALSVGRDTLLDSPIDREAEITRDQLDMLSQKDGENIAHERALTILSYRDHSKEDLRRKLVRTVGEENAKKAADEMEAAGLVNDEEFASKLAAELLHNRLMGKDRALFEMQKHGLDRETASEAIEREDTDISERIKRFIEKKYPRGIAEEKDRRRAVAALQRNGFRWDDIKEALLSFDEEEY